LLAFAPSFVLKFLIVMASFDLISQIKQSIATLTDPNLGSSDLTLTNCDREPIHISNQIQSHGVLIAFSELDFVILQISQNSEIFLGHPPTALLGQSLALLMNPEQIAIVQGCIDNDFENVNPLRLALHGHATIEFFDAIVHRSDDVLIMELEPSSLTKTESDRRQVGLTNQQQAVSFFDFYKFVKKPIDRIQDTQTLAELSQQIVIAIRSLTEFDRVLIYQFDQDGSGHVIAENKSEGIESYLGLHYPASDIPKQAKELYRLNLLRIIPNTQNVPVALVPKLNPISGAPLDMSRAVLRNVSPMHTEYLHNMGVQSSMSISLLCDQKLWGLIVCHHPTPKSLTYETRTICEFLGRVISYELRSKVDAEDLNYKIQLQVMQSRFVNTIASCQSLSEGFAQNPQDLIDLVSASGVAFCEASNLACFGKTPSVAAIADLIKWIDIQIGEDTIYSTNTLVTDYPQFAPYKDVASGLLALQIFQTKPTYLLWFRPEVLQTINWSGEPQKITEVNADNSPRIAPRKSFELWKQTVQLQSLPWKASEIEATLELRIKIIGILLQKADELAILNTELERSNIELDAFAYVASHDLKEPLRGIHNYSTFLMEDYGDKLGEDGAHKLATMVRLTQRMEDLIESLLHYSRRGREELLVKPVKLAELIDNVLNTIKISHTDSVDFRIPRSLPVIQCDHTLIMELFTNLISNAIRYNDRDQKWIEIGYVLPDEIDLVPEVLERSQIVFFVKDNGIGIQAKHWDNIFKIFKRLHPASKYGGGTGAGLTISKKIVERHGGKIVVESTFGEGSTFYFTLASP
jgi:two-component system, chemotaxis family, sensor kinase Cph1